MDRRCMTQIELAERWQISEATLERWRTEAGGPMFLKLGNQVRYRLQHPGGRAPMVVMVSAFHDPVDQVRAHGKGRRDRPDTIPAIPGRAGPMATRLPPSPPPPQASRRSPPRKPRSSPPAA